MISHKLWKYAATLKRTKKKRGGRGSGPAPLPNPKTGGKCWLGLRVKKRKRLLYNTKRRG